MGHFHEYMPAHTFCSPGIVVCASTKVQKVLYVSPRVSTNLALIKYCALPCRKFHRAMLQVVDKTLGVSFCELACLSR